MSHRTAISICVRAGAGALLVLSALAAGAQEQTPAQPEELPGGDVLRVCSDANNLPQSNDRGEGYENKLAEALAADLGRKTVEYTWFPQRMGFVRNTLRSRDETTLQYKCDLIMGVPKGYELTATTQPYMRSTYALIYPEGGKIGTLRRPEDLLAMPRAKRDQLRIGVMARSPGHDWLQLNDMVAQAHYYPIQSGDPKESPASIIGRDLAAGSIDAAIIWGPIAAWLVREHGDESWRFLPFTPHPTIKFDYEMSMGTRRGEKEWTAAIDQWIAGHRDKINDILSSYGIPLLDEKGALITSNSSSANTGSTR